MKLTSYTPKEFQAVCEAASALATECVTVMRRRDSKDKEGAPATGAPHTLWIKRKLGESFSEWGKRATKGSEVSGPERRMLSTLFDSAARAGKALGEEFQSGSIRFSVKEGRVSAGLPSLVAETKTKAKAAPKRKAKPEPKAETEGKV